MNISIISAMSLNGVIGVNNSLPWHLPNDLKRFKKLTTNNIVVMGKNTYSSMGFVPLKDRENIVLSRTMSPVDRKCKVVRSLDECISYINHIKGNREIFFIGGSKIYDQAMYFATILYLTIVHKEIEGDSFFPKFDQNDWIEIEREEIQQDNKNKYKHTFLTLERKNYYNYVSI